MVSKEFLGPIDLLKAQTLCIHETTKVMMICKDENLIFAAFQVMAPYFEGFDDSQKLAVVDLVLCFRWNHFIQKKRYSIPLA